MIVAARLDSRRDTQVWASFDESTPALVYWGPRLEDAEDLHALARAMQGPIVNGGLDLFERLSWLPEPGQGFSDHPGLSLRREGRRLLTAFRVRALERRENGLRWSLEDEEAGLALTLRLDADPESHVFSASVELLNTGDGRVQVDELASVCLPAPSDAQECLYLSGRWSAEFHAVREPLGRATWSLESRTGRPGHQAYPGHVLLTPGTSALEGPAWSAQLAWSGNHVARIQHTRWGPRQWQVGGLWLAGEIELAPGERFSTPVAHLLRSGHGLRKLAHGWHAFVRHAVTPRAQIGPRPVQFSTWEAMYFDHDPQRLRALASAAAELGVERFVLDDGWFVGRHHDRAGLGDWTPCPLRYPEGLQPLASHCQALGMQFGLWVEPEGVNPDSRLFEQHSQWCQHVTGRRPPTGRHQWVLDFGRVDVQDWATGWLDGLLRQLPIDFLKWDMNRDFAHEHGEDGRPTAAAHVRGVHQVIDRLRALHPHVEIETCASGGGRADLAMMARCERAWVSDCNDALERISMHGAALQFLPPERLGVHVGPAVSHTTGRLSSLKAQALVAWFGHLGIEADPLQWRPEERALMREVIAAYRTARERWSGLQTSLLDVADPALRVLWAVTPNASEGWLGVLATGRPQEGQPPRLRLPGLAASRRYTVTALRPWLPPRRGLKRGGAIDEGNRLALYGSTLAEAGLVLPSLWPGDACMLHLSSLPEVDLDPVQSSHGPQAL